WAILSIMVMKNSLSNHYTVFWMAYILSRQARGDGGKLWLRVTGRSCASLRVTGESCGSG
ncbi:MAG: hypothetical protein JXB29_08895, partial [Sedimentisphaerales bacterium]|nr:hypothetical protein [Sedimentisphaerales bacterium]